MRLLEHSWLRTGSPASRVQFELDRGDRHLLLDGKRAYYLGFGGCQTCAFLFERLGGANQPVQIEATAEALREGIHSLNDEVVHSIGHGLPEGEYAAALAEAFVAPVTPGDANDYFSHEQISLWGEDSFWCLPHNPRVPYFRAGDRDVGGGKRLFNFIVPMFPTKWLSMTTVAEYTEALRTKASGTAVSLAVLDVRSPVDWVGEPAITEHWCLTHYILDGHHKLNAAVEAGKELKLLTFIALGQGVSTKEDIVTVIETLSDTVSV